MESTKPYCLLVLVIIGLVAVGRCSYGCSCDPSSICRPLDGLIVNGQFLNEAPPKLQNNFLPWLYFDAIRDGDGIKFSYSRSQFPGFKLKASNNFVSWTGVTKLDNIFVTLHEISSSDMPSELQVVGTYGESPKTSEGSGSKGKSSGTDRDMSDSKRKRRSSSTDIEASDSKRKRRSSSTDREASDSKRKRRSSSRSSSGGTQSIIEPYICENGVKKMTLVKIESHITKQDVLNEVLIYAPLIIGNWPYRYSVQYLTHSGEWKTYELPLLTHANQEFIQLMADESGNIIQDGVALSTKHFQRDDTFTPINVAPILLLQTKNSIWKFPTELSLMQENGVWEHFIVFTVLSKDINEAKYKGSHSIQKVHASNVL